MTTNERDPVLERLFEGVEPPPTPTDLRSRVLGAARDAVTTEEPVDLWRTIWGQRGVRLAWAASVAFLLAGHFVVSFAGEGFGPRPDVAREAENQIAEPAVEFLRPIRIVDNVQPIVGLFASFEDPTDLEVQGEVL